MNKRFFFVSLASVFLLQARFFSHGRAGTLL